MNAAKGGPFFNDYVGEFLVGIYTFWSISGMEGNIHLTWDGGSLGVGDEIEVELTEIEEPTPCLNKVAHETLIERMTKIEKQDTNEQEIQEWKLQRYYRLKKILEEKGLL